MSKGKRTQDQVEQVLDQLFQEQEMGTPEAFALDVAIELLRNANVPTFGKAVRAVKGYHSQ